MEEPSEPKRRNAAKTRARILSAAFDAFAEHGYRNTGIRDVAERADVASSLILRYFGTKANLFHDALIFGIWKDSLFTRDKRKFGEQMARLIANDSDANLTAMMVLAIADPESREVASKVLKRHVLEPLAEWLGPPNAMSRAMDMYGLMSGFTIQIRMLDKGKVPPASVRWLAKAMQDIVDAG
ncbi:MAG: TetR family transcriptional regulator [Novosphingobium sp.]